MESESWMPNSEGNYSHERTQHAMEDARSKGQTFRSVPTGKNKEEFELASFIFLETVNRQKRQILTMASWRLCFYHYIWLTYFSKLAVITVVSAYYIFSFVIAITEVYPGSIKKPASVIAVTTVAAFLKGLLHSVLHRLSDAPRRYYTWVVRLLSAMAIIETSFKAGELLLIAKLVPNSEIDTPLDKWNVVGEVLKQLIVSVMCAWGFHRPQTIHLGNEGQHFEKLDSKCVAPLLSREEKLECLNPIYPYTDY